MLVYWYVGMLVCWHDDDDDDDNNNPIFERKKS